MERSFGMPAVGQSMQRFRDYVRTLKGNERGEGQVFCDRLFQAFGHRGYKEAGAVLEDRVRLQHGKRTKTKFADLVWKPRLLIEMKRRGEKLSRHYQQAFEYWLHLVPGRPRYVILCNFDEFWIYDFDTQLDEPMDRVAIDELPQRHTALNFLFPEERRPLFNNDRSAVTDSAARKIGEVFNALMNRGELRERAQRFMLQCVVAMFAEDTELLPRGLFTELVEDRVQGKSSYDLLGGLFRQMSAEQSARGGRYKAVDYFNGGIFSVVEPIDLNPDELALLAQATSEDWSKINPAIFGNLFQSSMASDARHRAGAHYTHEADIQRVVLPTIVHPFRMLMDAANTLEDYISLRERLLSLKVLDPACGSGNFLYIAYREMKRLELDLLERIHTKFKARARNRVGSRALVSTKQFYGIDTDAFAVELAKVTLAFGKKLALDEAHHRVDAAQAELPLEFDAPLPLDNLDKNIRRDDALFCAWPKVDVIIGNPPFQSKNKAQTELGADYLRRLRKRWPEVPGRADYCVYWFRRTHDELPEGGRAGLIGTNTIRQNYSREGGLDYIVGHGGTITHAVSNEVWPGDAVVHVSIVNWIKGEAPGIKVILEQKGDHKDSPWHRWEVDAIPPSLSAGADASIANALLVNSQSMTCYQGQTHGHEGFLLDSSEALLMIQSSKMDKDVLFPYLTGDDLLSRPGSSPSRYVIDFQPRDMAGAQEYKVLFKRIREKVLPDREASAERESARNANINEGENTSVNRHHQNFLNRWWLLSYPREELIRRIQGLKRYIVCSRVTKRPIFEFVSQSIRPSDALMVFCFEDDYSFGILQSAFHWTWLKARCSTLKGDYRYTSNTVYDSFVWPARPSQADIQSIAGKAVELRILRRKLMREQGIGLRSLYASLDTPGQHPLKEAQQALDKAVRAAYGMGLKEDILAFLLNENQRAAAMEREGQPVHGPGLPVWVKDISHFVSGDCVGEP